MLTYKAKLDYVLNQKDKNTPFIETHVEIIICEREKITTCPLNEGEFSLKYERGKTKWNKILLTTEYATSTPKWIFW